jgi:hypothetical protein
MVIVAWHLSNLESRETEARCPRLIDRLWYLNKFLHDQLWVFSELMALEIRIDCIILAFYINVISSDIDFTILQNNKTVGEGVGFPMFTINPNDNVHTQ